MDSEQKSKLDGVDNVLGHGLAQAIENAAESEETYRQIAYSALQFLYEEGYVVVDQAVLNDLLPNSWKQI